MAHEYAGREECSLFNSPHPYADGFSRAKCGCGWVSAPVKDREVISIYQVHVMQTLPETTPLEDFEGTY